MKNGSKRHKGVVKWFSPKLGYGFISSPDFDTDLFAHYKEIRSDDRYKNLRNGDKVAFSIGSNKNGQIATDIYITEARAKVPPSKK